MAENTSFNEKYYPIKKEDKYYILGSYPQSKVTDEAILSALGDFDKDTWSVFPYYLYTKRADYMYYIDKEYDGKKYRGIYFSEYRPCQLFENASSYQQRNGYEKNVTYWFLYEPILWLRLKKPYNEPLRIYSLFALDAQPYYLTANNLTRDIDGETVYENNYEHSSVRAWLNSHFYDTAFSEEEKAVVTTAKVFNAIKKSNGYENKYGSNNTEDKVYLIDYTDATNDYFCRPRHELYKIATDYAQCQGAYVYNKTDGDYGPVGKICDWHLRTPSWAFANGNYTVTASADITSTGDSLCNTVRGIVPAVSIDVEADVKG